ncbi:Hypothetical protein, putative, partial [Bodo saltans]
MSSSGSEVDSSSESESATSGPSTVTTGATTTSSSATGTQVSGSEATSTATKTTNTSATTGTSTAPTGSTTTTTTTTSGSLLANQRAKVVHFVPAAAKSEDSSSSESESDSESDDESESTAVSGSTTTGTQNSDTTAPVMEPKVSQDSKIDSDSSESESETSESDSDSDETSVTDRTSNTTTSTAITISTVATSTTQATSTTATTTTATTGSHRKPKQTSKPPVITPAPPPLPPAQHHANQPAQHPVTVKPLKPPSETENKPNEAQRKEPTAPTSQFDSAIAKQPLVSVPMSPPHLEHAVENHRYPTHDSPSDSINESTSSTDTGSTISESDNVETGLMAPTSVVKVAREKRFVSLEAPSNTAAFWPIELTVPRHGSRDATTELCKRVQAISGDDSSRVPRASIFVACRALGLDDSECAAVLFGLDDFVSPGAFYSLIDREALRVVGKSVESLFRSRDRFCSGEVRRSTVTSILSTLGICSTHLRDAAINVTLKDSFPPRACVTQLIPQSDPPQRTDVTFDVSPRSFQMFVDNVRGEVTCNGTPVCSRVLDASTLSEVVQAVQLCVYVTSLVDSCEDDEQNVEYERLIAALLAQTSLSGEQPKSLISENFLTTFGAASKIGEAMSTDHIEPFLTRATDKRSTLMPSSLQSKKPQSVDNPLMFSIVPQEVFLSQGVPQDSIRYLLITIVTAKNIVLPSVKVFAKPLKGTDTRVWHFSKKKVNNNIFLVGDQSDIVYVEVCTESPNDPSRRTCAGFATSPMINLESGAMGVKAGTFFRPMAVNDFVEESASCFCFSS